MRGFTAIEGFSGPGGLSLGLKSAGFEIRSAFDIDPWAVRTYRQNLGDHAFEADATVLTAKELLQRAGLSEGTLDLFAGGPPCQGFSKQKRGAHHGDDRNELVIHFGRLVGELAPKTFLLENVSMLGGKRGKQFMEKVHEMLRDYKLYPHFYNCADYGLAQTRERFVLVGKRHDVRTAFRIPKPTHVVWRTVGDVLNGLPEPPLDFSDHPSFPNHQRARVTDANIQRFAFVKQGGGWRDIPWEHRLECHKNVDTARGGWPDVYGRLEWEGQCPTITGGFDSFTRGRYGHPQQDRPITPREAARLQGFPDSFVFLGTRADIRSQIGNAVPPPLASAIGDAISRCLSIELGLIEGGEEDYSDAAVPIQLRMFGAA